MRKVRLEVIVFVCGAVLMILELAGSRVVAPFFGTSIYTWTSLIGVILGSLSAGYWWGGRLADRGATWHTLFLLLLAAAAGVFLCNLFKDSVLGALQGLIPDVRLGGALSVAVLFGPASLFLGTVSPYAVRLALHELDRSGSTVGSLYALSTLGSIAGTFLAGYLLLSLWGTARTLSTLCLLLLGVCLLTGREGLCRGRWILWATLGVLFILGTLFRGAPARTGRWDLETRYSHVVVEDTLEGSEGEKIRWLRTGPRWAQSAMSLKDPGTPYFQYNRFYALAEHFVPSCRRALLLGGGACTFPRYFLGRNPGALMDVVELDPGLTRIARRFFALREDPRLRIIHADGRTFLQADQDTYDVIFVDVFRESGNPPFHLSTLEAFEAMSRRLAPAGVLCMNVYSAILGAKGRFLRALYATLGRVFPAVLLFPVQAPANGLEVQNVLVVALKGAPPASPPRDALLAGYFSHLWTPPLPSDVPILTDDRAPVAHYLGEIIRGM